MTSNHDRHLLLRDHALETLSTGWNDFQACMLSLESGDDTGALHHFSRLIATIRGAAPTLSDLRALNEGGAA